MNEFTPPKADDIRLTDPIWGVIVIGAGPAGAVTALIAARSGATTLLVAQRRLPRAKVGGGCLNAPAVAILESLGLGEIASSHGLPIGRIRPGAPKTRESGKYYRPTP